MIEVQSEQAQQAGKQQVYINSCCCCVVVVVVTIQVILVTIILIKYRLGTVLMLFLEQSFKIDSSPHSGLFITPLNKPWQTLHHSLLHHSFHNMYIDNIYLFTLIMQSFLVVMKRSFSFKLFFFLPQSNLAKKYIVVVLVYLLLLLDYRTNYYCYRLY